MLLNIHSNTLSIKKTYLNCYGLPVWRGSSVTSALGYQPASLNAIIKLMEENLELREVTPIKTFSISYNENYTTPLVGQYEYGGAVLDVVPNFIGGGLSKAMDWCNTNGYNCSSEYADSDEPQGIVIEQSIHAFQLMQEVRDKTIVFTLSNGNNSTTPLNNNNNETNDNKENNENDNNENKQNNTEQNKEENNQTTQEPEPQQPIEDPNTNNEGE
jgi:hypothetical protein